MCWFFSGDQLYDTSSHMFLYCAYPPQGFSCTVSVLGAVLIAVLLDLLTANLESPMIHFDLPITIKLATQTTDRLGCPGQFQGSQTQ
jgi:hypothetical protein